jgi:hypothetical protein
MKYLLLFTGICIGFTMYSQEVIVFSKVEKCYLDDKHSPCNPEGNEKQGFMDDFKNKTFEDTTQVTKNIIITPPLEWGKKVSDTTFGEIIYYNSMKNGFITNINLYNLKPGHIYLLTLNGNPNLAGNNLLPDTVPNLSIERYYDFLSIKTDSQGAYHCKIGIYLKHGDYNVRFYVKDTDGYKIVLYHDYFKFTVS